MTGCSVPHNRGESELAYPGNRPIHSPGGAINDRGQVSAQRWRGRGPVCPQWLMIVPVEFAGTAEVQRRGGTRTRILITYLNRLLGTAILRVSGTSVCRAELFHQAQ